MYTAFRLVLFLASVGLAWAPAWAVSGARVDRTVDPGALALPATGQGDALAVSGERGESAPRDARTAVALPAAHALPDPHARASALASAHRANAAPRPPVVTHDARGPPVA